MIYKIAKKIAQQAFLRKGGTSVFSVPFGFAERSHIALRSDEPLREKIREPVIIIRARRVSLRQRPTFAHTCAYAERVKAAML